MVLGLLKVIRPYPSSLSLVCTHNKHLPGRTSMDSGHLLLCQKAFLIGDGSKKWDEFHLTREWEGYILARCPRSQYCFFFLLFSSSQSENGDEFKSDGMTFTHSAEIWTDHVCLLHAFCDNDQVYWQTRDLPGVALVITFFTTPFTKKEIEFLDECAFLHILQHDCKNIATTV